MTGRRHLFRDRIDAGSRLATRLGHLRGDAPVVVGLPRGGVPVAAQVARELDAPLDVILVRKLGVPFQPELAMGAIVEDDVRVLNTEIIRLVAKPDPGVTAVVSRGGRADLAGACSARCGPRRCSSSERTTTSCWT